MSKSNEYEPIQIYVSSISYEGKIFKGKKNETKKKNVFKKKYIYCANVLKNNYMKQNIKFKSNT